jgi:hypothetical protein
MSATLKDIADYFKTGDPARDSLGKFKDEWMSLSEEERDFFKESVGTALGK